MALLLNIDTATERASVSVSLDGISLGLLVSEHQKEHASFVHVAARQVLDGTGYKLADVEAISVTSGPGSYTGLRVGMATAKGFCYALSKPLITVNTLEVMTRAAFDVIADAEGKYVYCPMIDARRMEVFTALYNRQMEIIIPPAAIILNDGLFDNFLENSKAALVVFFGSGSKKIADLGFEGNYEVRNVEWNARHLGALAEVAFQSRSFADISYSEPNYFKEFFSTQKKA